MGLNYEGLDEQTRLFMIEEVDLDISKKTLYISPRLNPIGIENYPVILKEAIQKYSDTWLMDKLRMLGCMKNFEERKKPKGGTTNAKVPINAPETLAEGEFNRFYIRGICRRAIEEGISEVEISRGKQVSQPRPESELMIGKMIIAKKLLEDLRASPGIEPAFGLPPGPNSGLTVRLPRIA